MPIKGSVIAEKALRVFRKFLSLMKNTVWHYSVIAYHLMYTVCYITGVQTIRFVRYAGKRIMRLLIPIGRFIYLLADALFLKHIRSLIHNIAGESKRFAQGFSLAAHRVKDGFQQHPVSTVGFMLALPFIAIRRHRKSVFTLINLAAPVAAAFILVATVQYWSGRTFALAVVYDGKPIGYISNESVYDSAADMATERVINTDNSFEVQRTPKLTITYVSQSELLDENSVCDKILSTSSDSIAEVSGLYVDGKFEGAVESRSDLDALLQSLLDGYRDGSQNERAEFVQDVKVVDGLYPVSSIVSTDDMRQLLTEESVVDKYYTIVKGDSPLLIAAKTDMSIDQLRALNPDFDNHIFPDVQILIQKAQPFLRVQVVRTIEYAETIPFSTTKEPDTSQYIGYSKVKTEGQNGEQQVTAEVTLMDGIEQSRKVLSTTVTKESVDKVVIEGAKKVNPSVSAAGDGIVTGKFIWPVPSCHMISSGFGYRWGSFHSGIDISGNGVYGKDIIAADGGTVVEVNTSGWGAGYGKYIIIDHGGGYRTLYAHCSSILVTQGEKVSQGQLIGKIGQTGDATGPHLHFEIRINGQSVNPTSYLN